MVQKVDICVWSQSDGLYNFYGYIAHTKYSEVVFSSAKLFSIYGDTEFAYYGGILNAMKDALYNKVKKINILVSDPVVVQNIIEEKEVDNRFFNDIILLKRSFVEFNIGYIAIKDNLARFDEIKHVMQDMKCISFYDHVFYLALQNWSPNNTIGTAAQDRITGVIYGIPYNKRNKEREYALISVSDRRVRQFLQEKSDNSKEIKDFSNAIEYIAHADNSKIERIREIVWRYYIEDKMTKNDVFML